MSITKRVHSPLKFLRGDEVGFYLWVADCGKLTVAQALAMMTGYGLFHNHVTVDLFLSIFEFGRERFVRLRKEIWLLVFRRRIEAVLRELPKAGLRRGA